jgi:hypothetical protein
MHFFCRTARALRSLFCAALAPLLRAVVINMEGFPIARCSFSLYFICAVMYRFFADSDACEQGTEACMPVECTLSAAFRLRMLPPPSCPATSPVLPGPALASLLSQSVGNRTGVRSIQPRGEQHG